MNILVLLIIVNFLSVADGTLTWYGLKKEVLIEHNPLVLFFISALGITWGIIVPKIIVPVASIFIFWKRDYIGDKLIFIGLGAAICVYFFMVCYLAYGLISWAVNH